MPQLKDLTSNARLAITATYAFGAMQVASAVSSFWANTVISKYIVDETSVGIEGLERVDQVSQIIAITFLVVFIVVVLINGRWIYLASSNAAIVVPNAERIRPGWAVGWFFIPFASLWMPFKAMKQTWAASVGGGKLDSTVPTWFTIWWLSWAGLNISDGVSTNMTSSATTTLESIQSFNTYAVFSGLLWLIPSYLFVRIIKEVTAAQHKPSDVFA